jgi:transposase
MRKGFNGLSGLVCDHISHELLSGDAFIFLNKRRDRVKLLVWDRNGFVVWYKVLEQGTFELPAAENNTLEMSWTDIQLFLEGIEIKSVKRGVVARTHKFEHVIWGLTRWAGARIFGWRCIKCNGE